MSISEILNIIYIVAAFLVGLVPSVIGFVKAAKAKLKAKTTEESKAAETDMTLQAESLIIAAENFYKALDIALKANGESAGPYKKESVLVKLQNYATEKGYKFDLSYWSGKIDEIVKLTKSVNIK